MSKLAKTENLEPIYSATAMKCATHGVTNQALFKRDDAALYCRRCRKPMVDTGDGTLRRRRFELGGYLKATGYTDGSNWNGWGTPAFEKSEADKLVKQWNAQRGIFAKLPCYQVECGKPAGDPATCECESCEARRGKGYRAEYDATTDTYRFWDGHNDEDGPSDEATGRAYTNGKWLYDIGMNNWCWEYAYEPKGRK
jgi:hypothetical protein